MTSPIDKKIVSSSSPNPPEDKPKSPMAETAAKAHAVTHKEMTEPKIHDAGKVPPSQAAQSGLEKDSAVKRVKTRLNIPPNFKSLPQVLQLKLIENLKLRELETLKVSLGKGNPQLVEKINIRIADLKIFSLLGNILNKSVTLDKLRFDSLNHLAKYLSPSDRKNFSTVNVKMKEIVLNRSYPLDHEREIQAILKNHPDWNAIVVKNWNVWGDNEKLWLLHLYEIHQYIPISAINSLESSKPNKDSVNLMESEDNIKKELNEKYEELKKKLKFS